MPGRPTLSAVRRAGIAGALGAGIALVAVSVSGIASMDGELRAATERQRVIDTRVSYVTPTPRAWDCPRPEQPRAPRDRGAATDLPTT